MSSCSGRISNQNPKKKYPEKKMKKERKKIAQDLKNCIRLWETRHKEATSLSDQYAIKAWVTKQCISLSPNKFKLMEDFFCYLDKGRDILLDKGSNDRKKAAFKVLWSEHNEMAKALDKHMEVTGPYESEKGLGLVATEDISQYHIITFNISVHEDQLSGELPKYTQIGLYHDIDYERQKQQRRVGSSFSAANDPAPPELIKKLKNLSETRDKCWIEYAGIRGNSYVYSLTFPVLSIQINILFATTYIKKGTPIEWPYGVKYWQQRSKTYRPSTKGWEILQDDYEKLCSISLRIQNQLGFFCSKYGMNPPCYEVNRLVPS